MRVLICIAAFGSTLLAAAPARAVDVEQVEWGFDGQVVLFRFNVLSLLVSNTTPQTFDGVLELQKVIGGAQRVCAPLREPIYLAPYTSRWVQFYPYSTYEQEEYVLVWGRGIDERYPLPTPRAGEPARIILDDPDALVVRRGPLKSLHENLFPPLVTATDALDAVFVDHVPRWEGSRRTAFLDWLRRGGKVHLLQDPTGELPQFADELAVLNSPLERHRVGSGHVFRHNVDREHLDEKFLERVAEIEQESYRAGPAGEEIEVERPYAQDVRGDDYVFEVANSDWMFFDNLRSVTNPHHNWPAIYGLSLVYMLVFFPGCYVLAQRRFDYRLVFGAMLLAVAVFSLVFGVVGRRGYGEATSVNSVGIIRPLDDKSCDVSCWSSSFVTTGGDYDLTHAGEGRLYSTAQIREAVRGVIENGAEAHFLVDIPPFSSRSFAHRAKLARRMPELKIEEWEVGSAVKKLALVPGAHFPEHVDAMYALHRDFIGELKLQEGAWKLGRQQPFASFLREADQSMNEYGWTSNTTGWSIFGSEEASPEDLYGQMLRPLVTRSLGVDGLKRAREFSLPDDRVRVFIYAECPPELFVQNDDFLRQQGRVLYCIDLFGPENP